MNRYDPPVPRIGFGVAAVMMSAVTFSLMVVLPCGLEQQDSTLAARTEAQRTAANPAEETFTVPCAVATAVNAPLFARTPATAVEPKCKQPS